MHNRENCLRYKKVDMCVPESNLEKGKRFVNCRIDWDHEYKDKHNRGKVSQM